MEDGLNISLYITDVLKASELKIKVYEKELQDINIKHPLKSNSVNVTSTYFLKKQNILEVGVFIRNTLPSKISLEHMDVALVNSDKETILAKKVNFKELGEIPSCTGTPFTIEFDLPKGFIFDEKEQYKVLFAKNSSVQAFQSVSTELEGVALDLPFEVEEEIKAFHKGLNTLHKNQFAVSLFKVIKTNENDIEISVLLRNGYDKEVKLEKLPITIENYNGLNIFKGVFQNPEGIVKVGAAKAKFQTFTIESSKINSAYFEIDKCKILFK